MSDESQRILARLEVGRVFLIEKDGEDFVIQECCDNCFEEVLTRAELLQLAQEIKELADD